MRLRLELETALPLSRDERDAVRGIDTVVIPLGSYRNLTTMTAAIYALHPAAMVLNHAWVRLATKRSVDFLREPRRERLRRFVATAVRLAQGGEMGWHGGSILASHAFARDEIRRLYQARYGGRIVKPQARALFWKESMMVLNRIWSDGIDVIALCDELPQIRFLLPVRNPIDCAESVLRTGQWTHLVDTVDQPPRAAVLERLFDILVWFEEQRRLRPDAFMFFWEYDLNEQTLATLCDFSRLPFDQRWARDVLATIAVDLREHSAADDAALSGCIDRRLRDHPDLAARARAFLLPREAQAP